MYHEFFGSQVEMYYDVGYNGFVMDKTKNHHAYIIHGANQDGRREHATQITCDILCAASSVSACRGCTDCQKASHGIHPDVSVILGIDGKDVTIADIRALVRDMHILPNEGAKKVYVFPAADDLSVPAQNALLKALEEPPPFVAFLLLAQNPLRLLDTVRSRCVALLLPPAPDIPDDASEEHVALVTAFFDALQSDRLAMMEFCVQLEKSDRVLLPGFVSAVYLQLVAMLSTNPSDKIRKAIDLFHAFQTDLQFHVSIGHMSGKLLAILSD